MFPRSVLNCLDAELPKINPLLGNGLAVEHLKHVEDYIDNVFKVVAAGFPPGLVYEGPRRCTPLEEWAETTRKKNNRSVFDIARSDIYMVEYRFSYYDKETGKRTPLHSRYFSLPFVSKAGTIYLGGARFVISPVLSDRVISIGMTSVFVRLLKAKLTFNRATHHYVINGGTRESVYVVWSDVYNEKSNPNAPKPTVDANCTLVHYLLCKYGFTETFKRFAGCVPIVGGDELTEENYPASQWVICRSRQFAPTGYKQSIYPMSTLRLAIPIEHYTPMMRGMVGGFYYVVDHFPDRIFPTAEYYDSRRLWMVLLGHLIWSGNEREGILYTDVETHIASLDEYVDTLMQTKLASAGYHCPDIYTLFGLILENFNLWLSSSNDRVNTMYGKELSVLPYVCYPITVAIVKLYFKLKAAMKGELTAKKIEKIMDTGLKPGAIFKIIREHGEVTTTTTSGDNMALKITSLLVPQSSSSQTRSKKDRVAIADPAKRLHASIAEVGSYAGLPKSEPTGRSRLNLMLDTGPEGEVLRDPALAPLLDSVQAKLKRS